jgi:hypothetical protein
MAVAMILCRHSGPVFPKINVDLYSAAREQQQINERTHNALESFVLNFGSINDRYTLFYTGMFI